MPRVCSRLSVERNNIKKFFLLVITVAFVIGINGCSIRYQVEGQVVNAATGEPVEGAVVSVLWEKHHSSLPGLGGSINAIEYYDYRTKSEGKFKIPIYATMVSCAPTACLLYLFARLTYVLPSFMDYHLAIYKKGYVCWESQDVFPDYAKRDDFQLSEGMRIELEPFRDDLSKDRHAVFVMSVVEENSDWGNFEGLLYQATEEERALYQKRMRGKK